MPALFLVALLAAADVDGANWTTSQSTTEISLAAGWNLISLPLAPADPSPVAVLASVKGKYQAVYAYDPASASPWQLYDPQAPSLANNLSAMKVGAGFWILMREAAVLAVGGRRPDHVEVDLRAGWNLIGLPSRGSLPVGETLAAIAGKFAGVYAYDPSSPDSSAWQIYTPEAPLRLSDLRDLRPGVGYWLRATADAKLVLYGVEPATGPLAAADELARNGQYVEAADLYRQVIAEGEAAERRDARYRLAVVEAASGGDEAAVAELLSYLRAGPPPDGARRAYFLLGAAYHRLGEDDAAAGWLQRYLAADGPAATNARLLLADVLQATEPRRSVVLLEETVALDPSTPLHTSIIRQVAQAYEALAESAIAIAWYDRLFAEGDADDQAMALFRSGQLRRDLGDNATWERNLTALVRDYPRSSYALAGLQDLLANAVEVDRYIAGRVYYFAHANDAAMAAFDAYLSRYPDGAHAGEAHFYRAVLFERRTAWEDALAAYARSLAVTSDGSLADDAAWWRARLLEDLGRLAEAGPAYDLTLTRYPDSSWASDAAFRWGLVAYKQAEYGQALERWRDVAPTAGVARASLWAGKAAQAAGQTEAAKAYLAAATASSPRGYYGLRAQLLLVPSSGSADRSVVSTPLPNWREVEEWLSLAKAPDNDPFLDRRWRAGLELQAMGMAADAGRNWRALIGDHRSDPWALYLLARSFQRQRLTYPAALAGLYLNAPNAPATILRIAYPLDYLPLVEAAAQGYHLAPLLLLALIRQESLFDHAAGSVAGALGLTQVIPSTGRGIAQQLGWQDFATADLLRPVVSIEFGAFYLSQQLRLFTEGVPMALAAYNGGPGNALRWSESGEVTDPDLFLEQIDFSETHLYVRVVQENYALYRYLYGGASEPALPSAP